MFLSYQGDEKLELLMLLDELLLEMLLAEDWLVDKLLQLELLRLLAD
jgi:hypothetical protein